MSNTLFNAKVEYRAVINMLVETCWLCNFLVREKVALGHVHVLHFSPPNNLQTFFSKGMPLRIFINFQKQVGHIPHPHSLKLWGPFSI